MVTAYGLLLVMLSSDVLAQLAVIVPDCKPLLKAGIPAEAAVNGYIQ
ncbi:MAG: hypothetical protein ACXWE9_06830 [Methylobacter sp.]